jgi:hypothetical protein
MVFYLSNLEGQPGISCIVDRDRKDPRHRPSGLSGRRPRQARQPLAFAKTSFCPGVWAKQQAAYTPAA